MHIVKESVLEFKLTYMGCRLFGDTVVKSICKSIKAMVKCFVCLLKPAKSEDIFRSGENA